MKRRQFLHSIAAVAAAPALPGRVFYGSAGVSAAIYSKAVHYSRLWGTSVPEMYTSALGLNLEQANALFGRLVTDNVIATPNASGIAQAVAPYFKAPVLTRAATETIDQSVAHNAKQNPFKVDQKLANHIDQASEDQALDDNAKSMTQHAEEDLDEDYAREEELNSQSST